jgi:hypothetical protein
MITVRSLPRSSSIGALTLCLVVVAGRSTSAHRLDEYLQAARLSIDPGQVQITLDLTPGTAVAERVLAEIDLDRNTSISPSETQTYAARLLSAVTLELDGEPLHVKLVSCDLPAIDVWLKGEGTMRIHAVAPAPYGSDGIHELQYRNGHRQDISVYLANALVPASPRVTVNAQRRDTDQRRLIIDYTVRPDAATRISTGTIVGVTGTLLWLTTVSCRRSRSRNRVPNTDV